MANDRGSSLSSGIDPLWHAATTAIAPGMSQSEFYARACFADLLTCAERMAGRESSQSGQALTRTGAARASRLVLPGVGATQSSPSCGLALDRPFKVWKAPRMGKDFDLRSASALFRIHGTLNEQGRAQLPRDSSSVGSSGRIHQERLVIPMNRMMGRRQLEQPRDELSVYSPGKGGDDLYVVPRLDYFDRMASREHCMIEVNDESQVCVRDLGSTFGTTLKRGPDGEHFELTPGISYPLQPGSRLRLGRESCVEYEFTGVTSDLHIRLRYWSRDIEFPLEQTPFEWMSIERDGGCWSSADMPGFPDKPLHDPPHIRVRSELRGAMPIATVELEASAVSSEQQTQQFVGSMIHCADLDTSGEPDIVHHFRTGYELLMPGPSAKETGIGPAVDHSFLRPQYLRIYAVLDRKDWLTHASIAYSHIHTPEQYRTPVGFKGDIAQPTTSLQEIELEQVEEILRPQEAKKPSVRKAIVAALLEKRRQDLIAGLDSEMNWVNRQDVEALRGGEEMSEDSFQNNFTRWRSELASELEQNAFRLRETRSKTLAIPEKVDWNRIVESRSEGGQLYLRLGMSIELRFLRASA